MGDQGDGDFSDADRKVRLQEKNRKAQQAFRSRQKVRCQGLSTGKLTPLWVILRPRGGPRSSPLDAPNS